MWDWLKQDNGYSAGAAYPLIGILLLLAATGLLFGGLLALKTRSLEVPFADHRLSLSGDPARFVGLAMCGASLAVFYSLYLLVL